MVVDWCSSNYSRKISRTYLFRWLANIRMIRSMFPGSFPLTLHDAIPRNGAAGGLTLDWPYRALLTWQLSGVSSSSKTAVPPLKSP